ncbi:MAG: hypothetical protein QOE36_2054 [Gaiellaceae bacterium]|jgi:hypothetical protein|nr:hypothetical protein [Gaiellaceae bacterium]
MSGVRQLQLVAALAAIVVCAGATLATHAAFTAALPVPGNVMTVDSLANYFQVTPGTAVQPGTSTPVASGNVNTLALSFGTVPSARTFTSVFTVKNVSAQSQTAVLSVGSVSQIASAVFASSGTATAALAAGASTTVTVITSSAFAGRGLGIVRLRLSSLTWLYRDYATLIDEAPEAPATLTATARPAGAVRLVWAASTTTTGLTGYDVYRSTGAAYTKLNASPQAGLTYDDAATVNATAYTYKVVAVSTGPPPLVSLDSPIKAATADATAPAQPTTVSLANGGGTGSAYVNLANRSSVSVAVVLPAGSIASDTVTVTISNGAGPVTATAPASAGAGTVTLTGIDTTSLGDGTLTISATSTDLAGNISAARAITQTKDTVAPAAPGAAYVDNSNPAADQITGAAGATDASATLTARRTLPTALGPYTATAAANGSYSITVGVVKNTSVTHTVTATDLAGNLGAATTLTFVTTH